jgi:C-terminal processing protease CtpA/Prc
MTRIGTILLVCSSAVVGCKGMITGTSATGHNVSDFEATWAWVDSLYPALEMKGIDWDAVYSMYRPRAEAARGDEIFQVLHDLVELLEDTHAFLQTAGGAVVHPHVTRRFLRDRHAFSPHLVREYFSDELLVSPNHVFEYQVMDGNVGYLRIATFDPGNMMDDLPTAMEYVRNTDALIVDIRNNNGGQSENVDGVVSRFIESPVVWMDAFEQDGVPFEPWPPIEPDESQYTYTNPIAMLINGAAMSSGELFPELMKQLPSVTAVGDTTAGSACNDFHDVPGDLRLDSGRRVHIPTGCVGRYDGELIERNGVPPDIHVPMTVADIEQGRDVQLEAAIQVLADSGWATEG